LLREAGGRLLLEEELEPDFMAGTAFLNSHISSIREHFSSICIDFLTPNGFSVILQGKMPLFSSFLWRESRLKFVSID
jgi:hypothetical protein